jgi:NADH-quinone oxidoreductase subunit M
MTSQQLLVTIFLPFAGAIFLWLFAGGGREIARWSALVVSLLTLFCAGQLVFGYVEASRGGQAIEYAVTDAAWLSGGGAPVDIRFSVGIDGPGVWLFGLTALLFVTSVLVSFEAITERASLFYGMLLLLEFGCLGVFVARDIILFYVFFEFTLIPLFFLIGIWGSEERRHAAIKFFLFTLAGSLLTFLGLLAIVLWDYQYNGEHTLRFSIPALTRGLADHPLPFNWEVLIFLALFAGFAIKVPLFPLHTWLPLAHTQAPTAGSVILAGILLKIGVYGFLRFSVPMLPQATLYCMPVMMWLAALGIVYGALVALAQSDMKRLIAYSSVSHLGYCMLGLFALNATGVQGSVLQMVNHGLSTGALFAMIGMIYERYHTRQIAEMSGLAARLPWLAFFMVLFTFSSIGVPGLNGFAGEFLILLGAFQRAWADAPLLLRSSLLAAAVFSVSGVVLGAWYMLWLVQRLFFGPLKEPTAAHGAANTASHDAEEHEIQDLSIREILALAPLAVFVIWIGVRPGDFLQPMQPTLELARRSAAAALDETRTQPQMTNTENQMSKEYRITKLE